jgi:hypothetical protein
MSETLKIILPALITLTGTVAGLAFVFKRWKSDLKSDASKSFRKDRSIAYKKLWSMVEDIHVKIRTSEVTDEEFHGFVREINAYVLKSHIFFEDDIQKVANEYLVAVRELKDSIEVTGDRKAMKDFYATKEHVGLNMLKTDEKFAKSRARVDLLRADLIQRVRRAQTD